MTLFISVRRAVLKNNKKNGTNNPPFEVRQFKEDNNPTHAHQLTFRGTTRLVYDPHNPLPSGAVAWIEVDQEAGAPMPSEQKT